MIGIVAVSHSHALAAAAVDLALQMGGADPPAVRIAAGGPDGTLGTDAAAIATAIDEADSGDGVLVLMDLGSALLSAEMATELVTGQARVALSPAPFVEGLVIAVVTAVGGASLDTVAAECAGAIEAKRRQLGEEHAGNAHAGEAASGIAASDDGAELWFDAVIAHPSGLHARPAALFVKAASRHDADVRIADLDAGSAPVSARSLLAVMALGVRQGAHVRVSARGDGARAALDELRAVIDDGFGER